MASQHIIEIHAVDGVTFTYDPPEGENPFDPFGNAMEVAEQIADEGVWNMETHTFYPPHSIVSLSIRERNQH